MQVAVLGTGISGVTTAYFLARMGHDVVVFERGTGPAAEASHRNGGVAGGTQIEPWAKPGLPAKLIGWIGKDDAPIMVHPSRLFGLIDWGIRFLRNCTADAFDHSLRVNARLTLHSLATFEAVRQQAEIDPDSYDFSRRGAVKVFLTPESFQSATITADKIRAEGFRVEAVAPSHLAEFEPGLRPAQSSIAGALRYPDEQIGDCAKFCAILERHCREGGTEFRYGDSVRSVVVESNQVVAIKSDSGRTDVDAAVVATASFSPLLLRSLGLNIPVVPVKGVSVTVPVSGWPDAVRGAVMDHARLFGIMRIGDQLRITGLAELNGHDASVSVSRCQALVRAVLELLPGFAGCLERNQPTYWSGLRGNTPDGRPILGKTPIAGLFLNVGHGPQGWSTSCGSADLVAHIVSGSTPPISIEGLGLERFGRLPWRSQ